MLKCMTRQSADLLEVEENTETAILDTGCARSTSGRQWIEAHIRSLSQEDSSEVRRERESILQVWNRKNIQVQGVGHPAGILRKSESNNGSRHRGRQDPSTH